MFMTEALMDLPCLAANLRRADRAVGRLYGSEIRRSGIEPTQFTLLSVLAHLDEATQGELAERLAVDYTTQNRTLGRIEERGCIKTPPGPNPTNPSPTTLKLQPPPATTK